LLRKSGALADGESFIAKLESAIKSPSAQLSPDNAASIGKTERVALLGLNTERKALFWFAEHIAIKYVFDPDAVEIEMQK